MDTKTMSRKKKRAYDNTVRAISSIAGECVMCRQFLKAAKPPREQKTRVYAKRGNVRYCVCDNCGNTWKVSPNSGDASQL